MSDQTLSSTELMAELGSVKGLLTTGLEKLQLTPMGGGLMSRLEVVFSRLRLSLPWLCLLSDIMGTGEAALLSWLITQL